MGRKPAKVFIDSNVIISGIFSDTGSPRLILDLLCLGLPFIRGATGRYNIIEIERNLKRKMPQAIPTYKKYLPELNLEVISIPSEKEIQKYRGHIAHKDVPVLVSAIKGDADFLVTGDKKHFSKLKKCEGLELKVISPSEFLEKFITLFNDFQVK